MIPNLSTRRCVLAACVVPRVRAATAALLSEVLNADALLRADSAAVACATRLTFIGVRMLVWRVHAVALALASVELVVCQLHDAVQYTHIELPATPSVRLGVL